MQNSLNLKKIFLLGLCLNLSKVQSFGQANIIEVFPEFQTDTVLFDTDDPAIYFNKKRPSKKTY
jgi:hypothetical protein